MSAERETAPPQSRRTVVAGRGEAPLAGSDLEMIEVVAFAPDPVIVLEGPDEHGPETVATFGGFLVGDLAEREHVLGAVVLMEDVDFDDDLLVILKGETFEGSTQLCVGHGLPSFARGPATTPGQVDYRTAVKIGEAP